MKTVGNNINILISREENHLDIHESYLEKESMVSSNGGGIIANDANVRLVNYGVRAPFSLIKLETISGKTVEYIDHGHLLCKLLTSTSVEYESGFVRDQREKSSQLKGGHQAAQRGHMYMMNKMKDLFGFINDLGKNINGIGFKLIL